MSRGPLRCLLCGLGSSYVLVGLCIRREAPLRHHPLCTAFPAGSGAGGSRLTSVFVPPAMCLLTSPATQAVSSLRRTSVAEAVFAAPRGGYTYDLCTFLCACCISVRYLIGKQTQKVKQFMQTVFHQTPLSALLFSGSYSCTAASHRPQVRAVARKTVPAFVCLMHGPRAEPRAVQEPGVPVPAWPPTCPTCSSAVRV